MRCFPCQRLMFMHIGQFHVQCLVGYTDLGGHTGPVVLGAPLPPCLLRAALSCPPAEGGKSLNWFREECGLDEGLGLWNALGAGPQGRM